VVADKSVGEMFHEAPDSRAPVTVSPFAPKRISSILADSSTLNRPAGEPRIVLLLDEEDDVELLAEFECKANGS